MTGQWLLIIIFWQQLASVTTYPDQASCEADRQKIVAYYQQTRSFLPSVAMSTCVAQTLLYNQAPPIHGKPRATASE